MAQDETPRRVPWERRVYYWKGRKYCIAIRKTFPFLDGSGPLLIRSRQQMLAVFGAPMPPTNGLTAAEFVNSCLDPTPPLRVVRKAQ